MRLAAGIEYDGASFCGWQRQALGQSIQACIEQALSRFADYPISVTCAGRTDAGVHALQQVIHFDTHAIRAPRAWLLGPNVYLPPSIRLLWVKPAPPQFHARFCAKVRAYRYIIYCNAVASAILHKKVTFSHTILDVEKMQEAAKFLVGTHNFSAFRGAACQAKQPIKTIHTLQVSFVPQFVTIDIEADGFLHHMVRNIAGVLMTIGRNIKPPLWAREVLDSKDRKRAGPTAPADGLYFVGVHYDEKFNLPKTSEFSTRWGIFKGENRDSPP